MKLAVALWLALIALLIAVEILILRTDPYIYWSPA